MHGRGRAGQQQTVREKYTHLCLDDDLLRCLLLRLLLLVLLAPGLRCGVLRVVPLQTILVQQTKHHQALKGKERKRATIR